MRKIYDAADILEAHILKGLLEQCGISGYVGGFYLQGGVGELPVSGHTALWVEDEDFDRAAEVIRNYDEKAAGYEV